MFSYAVSALLGIAIALYLLYKKLSGPGDHQRTVHKKKGHYTFKL